MMVCNTSAQHIRSVCCLHVLMSNSLNTGNLPLIDSHSLGAVENLCHPEHTYKCQTILDAPRESLFVSLLMDIYTLLSFKHNS